MKLLDLTLPTPAENLACDEALLDLCESDGSDEILRFWEPRNYFVVVGYANRVATEVNVAACETRNIPILRRCSGGGTVLQGPGCLNYSLILRGNGPLANITSANRFIMEKNRAAIQSAVHSPQSAVEVYGYTDLAIGHPTSAIRHPLKFSGNAQRRRKQFLLFHGTFLLDFDFRLMSDFLPMPSRQPAYRQNRTHESFLTNLPIPAISVKSALRACWNASEPMKCVPLETIASLTRDRYATIEWNFKF